LAKPPNDHTSPAAGEERATVVVWDLPLRIHHWALAASVLIAWCTANIFDFVHEIAGYTVIVLLGFRLFWGFAGNRYARFRNFVRPLRTVFAYLRQVMRGETGRYLGLNPAGAAMAVALLALLAVSSVSGWMQITERYFGVEWVERVHTWSSNLVLILVVLHVLGVGLMCALQKENLVRAMFTGRKRAR
jgi:cytochrome b